MRRALILSVVALLASMSAGPALAESTAYEIEDSSAQVTYTWPTVSDANASGGSYVYEHRAGSYARFAFTGTTITWYTRRGPNQGGAYVYVDGSLKQTLNNYAAAVSERVSETITGLANTAHSLKIYVRGLKGSSRATDSRVSVDAVRVNAVTLSTPALTFAWGAVSTSTASAGHYTVSDLMGATAEVHFTGPRIVWSTTFGPTMGRGTVQVDAAPATTFDNYAPSVFRGNRPVATGLSSGAHTLRLRVAGTHQSGATGSAVVIDRFFVSPPPPTGLVAATEPNAVVHLTWNSVAGAESYTVFRKVASSPDDPVAVSTTTAATYDDTPAAGAYTYSVTAVANGQSSVRSRASTTSTSLALVTVSPATAPAGQTTSVTLTTSGFTGAATSVRLSQGSVVFDFTPTSAPSNGATFDVTPDVPAGLYDVTVFASDGQAIKQAALQLTATG